MRSATPLFWIALVVLAAPPPGLAVEPHYALTSDYTIKVWETDDGLPHNSIAAVEQRADGTLWIATAGGLVRFDGLQFTTLQSPLLEGVRSANVSALIREDAQTLLAATHQSGLVRIRDGIVSPHPLTDRLVEQDRIAYLFREYDDVFWVVFANREVWRWERGAVQTFSAPPPQRSFWPASFARDGEGNIFIARGAGLEQYAGDELRPVAGAATTMLTIASRRAGGIWVARDQRLLVYGGGQFTLASPAPWNGGTPPTVLYEDRAGAVWLSPPEDGLLRWKDGAVTAVADSPLRVTHLLEDDEGNLWASTRGAGLHVIQRRRLVLVAAEPDWTDLVSAAVSEDLAGNIWFANRKALRRITAGRVETISGGESGWPNQAFPICADPAGHIWFALGPDLYRGGHDAVMAPERIHEFRGGAIHVLFAARDGSMWAGGNSRPLQRHRPDGGLDWYGPEVGFTGKSVRAMGEDAEGNLWVGTEEGKLFRFAEAMFVEQHVDELPGNAIRAIHGDAEGNLWLGTAGAGLLLRRDGRLVRLAQAEGLPDDVISHLLEDDHGWLWFGSRRGIFKVRKADLLDYARGRRTAVTPISFGRGDGLSGISAVGSYQPTAWKTRSGQLWFVTRKGLVTTDPSPQATDERRPRVLLERVLVDDRPVDPVHPRITSAARKIEFRFTAPTFIAPERVRFRYRLDGYDADWVEGETRRFATYPALPPGTYVFSVNASFGDGAWTTEGPAVELRVPPMWWETLWAKTGATSLSLFALVAMVRYASHRRLKARLARLEQQQRLEQERVRIARDLHDDLGASLTQAGLMADELAEDWRELSEPQVRSSQLAQQVRSIARDLDAVVWTVSPKHDNLSALAAYLGSYAAEYFRSTPIECRVRTRDEIPPVPLSPEIRHHLFLSAKELLNNVLKHSHATLVDVRMRCAGESFELVVADDGRGFSVAEVDGSERNGLRNLRTRAAEAGGTVDLASSAQGTTATLRYPLPRPARAERRETV